VQDCMSRVLNESSGADMVNMIENLENLDDISILLTTISQKTAR